ncbi:DUF3618 domain-containing protein [Corynebacterium halotolerans]|uniref:DUF3618 domain-containing protein n=1 Tax=Corynebacterium halotolerans YIM 70093 = DSM 44683 TaxID=1121362 RepID=M1NP11_9CORY|nr:DUF3618 domain-containing protein [Corynebacterium halotolerans]AGF71242.1 hypothetical protein A605_01140 [Corynebacterium halotolerans YIM 70093 = DSM 44683]
MTNPDDIRADIERTRGNLGRDVDALAEKVDPNKAVERQTDKIRGKWTDLRESVMGSPDHDNGQSTMQDARDRAGEMADEAGQMARNAPEQVKRRARGNPLAAGLIALGAGWLAGSLLPASQPEQDAAAKAKEKAEPALEEAKSVAQDMGESLQPQAQEAAESVKDSATAGAQHVKSEGQHRATELKDDSRQAAQRVKDTTQES